MTAPGTAAAGESLAAFGVLALWFWRLRARPATAGQPAPVVWLVRRTHVLPVALQGVLYVYWMLYSEPARVHASVVLIHICFGVLFETLLGFQRDGAWRISLAAVPAAVSMNLFIWYEAERSWVPFVLLAFGLGAKRFILWQGRHLFNPSALAIALGALAASVAPSVFRYEDIASAFSFAPNMLELVFLASLVPLALLRTAPVTVGGFLAMYVLHGFHFTPLESPQSFFVPTAQGSEPLPFPFWAPWLLTLTLFAGDPATVPRTAPGRLLNGLIMGTGLVGFSYLLYALGGSDFFAKALAVVTANTLVPLQDRIGRRIAALLPVLERPRANWVWLGLYVAMLVGNLSAPFKQKMFEVNGEHIPERPRVWDEGGGGCASQRCQRVFFRPFSFVAEARLWAASDEPRPEGASSMATAIL